MRRLPILLHVFYRIVFLGFRAVPSIGVLFVSVVTRYYRKIFFKTLEPCFVEWFIIFISRSTRARDFWFAFLFSRPLFGLFLSLFRGLCSSEGIICGLRVLGFWLRLFNSNVFYSSARSLYLGRGDVSRTIALLSLVVHLSDMRCRLAAYFGFSLDRPLHNFFTGVKFSTLLFYLGLYRGFKTFLKESNKVKLF